jgi:hypothetical protein
MLAVPVTVMVVLPVPQSVMLAPLSLKVTVSVPVGATVSGVGNVTSAVKVTGAFKAGEEGFAVTLVVVVAFETVTEDAGLLAALAA